MLDINPVGPGKKNQNLIRAGQKNQTNANDNQTTRWVLGINGRGTRAACHKNVLCSAQDPILNPCVSEGFYVQFSVFGLRILSSIVCTNDVHIRKTITFPTLQDNFSSFGSDRNDKADPHKKTRKIQTNVFQETQFPFDIRGRPTRNLQATVDGSEQFRMYFCQNIRVSLPTLLVYTYPLGTWTKMGSECLLCSNLRTLLIGFCVRLNVLGDKRCQKLISNVAQSWSQTSLRTRSQ